MSTILGNIISIGGSSSSGNIYALISVTYPFGSTCTATNGTTTLTAATTTGQVCFVIPEPTSTPETWTVSCSSGSSSASTTVSINSKGQVENVVLAYTISFYIDENEYHADPGMTWEQWVNSGYNTIGASIYNGYYIRQNATYSGGSVRIISTTGSTSDVVKTDLISSNTTYHWFASAGAGVKT